jgi:hypothetical protein
VTGRRGQRGRAAAVDIEHSGMLAGTDAAVEDARTIELLYPSRNGSSVGMIRHGRL